MTTCCSKSFIRLFFCVYELGPIFNVSEKGYRYSLLRHLFATPLGRLLARHQQRLRLCALLSEVSLHRIFSRHCRARMRLFSTTFYTTAWKVHSYFVVLLLTFMRNAWLTQNRYTSAFNSVRYWAGASCPEECLRESMIVNSDTLQTTKKWTAKGGHSITQGSWPRTSSQFYFRI
jgi:hypothetical protein